MLAITIPSDHFCLHPKIEESIDGRAIIVLVVVQRKASFERIYDRQMFWPRISLKKRADLDLDFYDRKE